MGFLIDRGRPSKFRVESLHEFARHIDRFELVVFPEGTRGNGSQVGRCQPGVLHVAEEAGVPIVPIALCNMQRVSTKKGRFHLIGGLRQVVIRIGEEFTPDTTDRVAMLIDLRRRLNDLLQR